MTATDSPRRRRRAAAESKRRQRSDDRARRWLGNRYSIPYSLDGPKLILGTAWFVGLIALLALKPVLVGLLIVPVASIAGIQTANAWGGSELCDRRVAGGVAAAIAVSAYFGPAMVGAVLIVAILVWAMDGYAMGATDYESLVRFIEIGIRSSLPAGLAGASLILLATSYVGAFVAVVLLVSAYEMGDFLVGTGADNALEGPVAGMLAVGVVGLGLTFVQPIPFTSSTMPLYAGLIAVTCPLGQLFASVLLPRGVAWAPALRRMDSYLVGTFVWWITLPV